MSAREDVFPSAAWPMVAMVVGMVLTMTGPALAEPAGPGQPSDEVGQALARAQQQTGLPLAWLEAVVEAESGGDPRAISRAGAMGLMQLMPGTWAQLRTRLGLGADPFDVGDNVLAGAAYLRELFERYGARGFLAAYNAGPRRWEDHLRDGRPLPAETQAYVARLAPRLGLTDLPSPPARDWRAAPLAPNGDLAPGLTAEARSVSTNGLFPAAIGAPQ